MANYFARVELHGAEWPDDYELLHDALAFEGFNNYIKYDNGRRERLPTAFYFAQGISDHLEEVYRSVKECAKSTGYKYELTVVKSNGSRSSLSRSF